MKLEDGNCKTDKAQRIAVIKLGCQSALAHVVIAQWAIPLFPQSCVSPQVISGTDETRELCLLPLLNVNSVEMARVSNKSTPLTK
jgi:hypothetical protein